jgi:hypothetical protein
MSYKCGGGSGNDALMKYARASDDLAKTIGAMITTKRALAREGQITPAEELRITRALLEANNAAIVFNNRVKSLNAAPDATTKADLAVLFANVTSTLNHLNQSGIFNINDLDARYRFSTYKNSVDVAVATLSQGLGCEQITEDCVKCADGKIYCSKKA